MSQSSIYIAGPMRGIPYFNFPMFDAYAKAMRNRGHVVISPADLDREAANFDATKLPAETDWSAIPEGFSLRACIERDLKAVLDCDEIHLLPGYEHSKGCMAELAVALWAGKQIRRVSI